MKARYILPDDEDDDASEQQNHPGNGRQSQIEGSGTGDELDPDDEYDDLNENEDDEVDDRSANDVDGNGGYPDDAHDVDL